MTSRKRSAWAKETAAFRAELGDGLDDLFDREQQRKHDDAEAKAEAMRRKACESKQRYRCRDEAEAAIASCAEHGVRGLRAYRCPHCGGWHLTSKQARD